MSQPLAKSLTGLNVQRRVLLEAILHKESNTGVHKMWQRFERIELIIEEKTNGASKV